VKIIRQAKTYHLKKSFIGMTDDEIMEELRKLRPKLEAGLKYLRGK